MKRLLSSFLTIIMVMSILTCVPMTASAADVDFIVPEQEVNLTWDYDTKYAYIEVDESGYYNIAIDGEDYGYYYYCYIYDDNQDTFYSINSWGTNIPRNFMNLYLEAGISYTFQTYCYDDNGDMTGGDLTVLLTKSDYEPLKLTSSSQGIFVANNEYQWFILEPSTSGDYKIDFGGEYYGTLYNYESGKYITDLGNGSNIFTLNLTGGKKYLARVQYSTENTQRVNVSFSKQKKTISKVELSKAKILADEYPNEKNFNYKVTYTDNSTETVDYYFFWSRGVNVGIEYTGKYSDKDETYKAPGKQSVKIHCNNKSYKSSVTVVKYLDYFSDITLHVPYDDLRISHEDTYYKQYFWRIKVNETNKYNLYSSQWKDNLFDWYHYTMFDKNNKEIAFKNGGFNLKAGEEYILMFEYRYNDYEYANFYFSLDPKDAHGDHTHTSSKWITDKKATVTKAGKKHKECTDCGKILKTAKIAELKCSKPKLKDIENTADGVKITWGKVTGADKYAVYRKTGSGKYTKIGTTTKTYYTDKKASSGKKYSYTVKAVNGGGNSDSSNSKSIEYLADPTLKTPSSTKKGIVLKWSKASGADGYMVYRKTGSGSYSKIATVKGSSKVTYTDKKAKKGKTYTYKIKAYDGKTYSAYSNAKKIKDKY